MRSPQSDTAFCTADKVYSDSIVVDEDVKRVIRECFDLGPLHNPANLMGIEAC